MVEETAVTHLFYHQEKVEAPCALNSWLSIRDFFSVDDEVIVLDLGSTLENPMPFTSNPKFIRFEKIRTDIPQEQSYTYGLNEILPKTRNEWVLLWRSDYIYHKKFFKAVRKGMERSNVVLPYEAYVGLDYSTYRWCKRHLKKLINSNIEFILKHSRVCPTYETMDFPHFAIKKSLWIGSKGMDGRLWGYGPQFSEFFYRIKKRDDYKPSIQFDMIAFHQRHLGSFSFGAVDEEQKKEAIAVKKKILDVFGTEENYGKFKESIKQEPLRARWPDEYYKPRKLKKSLLSRIRETIF